MLALRAASKPSCKKQVGNVKIDLAEDNRGLKQRMLGLEAKLQAMEDGVEQEVSAHDLTNIILSSFLPGQGGEARENRLQKSDDAKSGKKGAFKAAEIQKLGSTS